jgi:hypothetical protein
MEPRPEGIAEAAERLLEDFGLVMPLPQLERLIRLVGQADTQ